MADIKSALEIAMEKIEKLGDATEEERLKWKYLPEGERLAAKYLKEDCNLVAELSQHQEGVRKYVTEGAAGILARNINLPRNEVVKKTNKKMMDGLKVLKKDKVGVENVYSRIRHLFNHYSTQGEQQRKQAHEALKADFETKLQQAAQKQLGSSANMKIDVERQPQFQQELRKVMRQLETSYVSLLEEYKRELLSLP